MVKWWCALAKRKTITDFVEQYKILVEEINNFYVALTRPKNNLIVIYEDRLFEENPLNESNIDDFFACELGEISLNEKISKTENENIIEENLENHLLNSQSYFSASIYENEEEIPCSRIGSCPFPKPLHLCIEPTSGRRKQR